jgi:hypothetical protein
MTGSDGCVARQTCQAVNDADDCVARKAITLPAVSVSVPVPVSVSPEKQ